MTKGSERPVDRVFRLSSEYSRTGTLAVDLKFVADACERLLLVDAQRDPVVAEALWIEAAITYVRCFEKTRLRLGLEKAVVEKLAENKKGIHQFVIRVRDEYLAHVQARLEAQEIGIEFQQDTEGVPLRAVGVAALSRKFMTPPRERIELLRDLARRLRDDVDARLGDLRGEVLGVAQTLSRDESIELQRREVPAPQIRFRKEALALTRRRPRRRQLALYYKVQARFWPMGFSSLPGSLRVAM